MLIGGCPVRATFLCFGRPNNQRSKAMFLWFPILDRVSWILIQPSSTSTDSFWSPNSPVSAPRDTNEAIRTSPRGFDPMDRDMQVFHSTARKTKLMRLVTLAEITAVGPRRFPCWRLEVANIAHLRSSEVVKPQRRRKIWNPKRAMKKARMSPKVSMTVTTQMKTPTLLGAFISNF